MGNSFFRFKKFEIKQDRCAMKVCTDACLFGAYTAMLAGTRQIPSGAILDIGGGTGLLSLMLAQKTTGDIDAIEIDQDAFVQMKDNFGNSPWSSRLTTVFGDVREMAGNRKYDLIVSNPPFFENQLRPAHQSNTVARHDSTLKLAELIPVIKNQLAPGGRYAVLIPFFRLEETKALLKANKLSIHENLCVRHSVNHPVFRCILIGGPQEPVTIRHRQITQAIDFFIHTEDGNYSAEFIALLKDYYLFVDSQPVIERTAG